MPSIEPAQIESIAKRRSSDCLVIEFVRGVLQPQNRGSEAGPVGWTAAHGTLDFENLFSPGRVPGHHRIVKGWGRCYDKCPELP